jgi:hypothetical protein
VENQNVFSANVLVIQKTEGKEQMSKPHEKIQTYALEKIYGQHIKKSAEEQKRIHR